MTAPLVKEMALTRAEFLRLLPGAVDGAAWRDEGDVVHVGETVAITLEPLPPRRLGLFAIPVMRVTLTFSGWTETEVRAFVQRFDRAFQKGGG